MCSKLSVLDQGRIKTCASLSRPLQVTVRSILQQTFYSYCGRSGRFKKTLLSTMIFDTIILNKFSCNMYNRCIILDGMLKSLCVQLQFVNIISDFLRQCHLGSIICLFLIILTHDHAHICIYTYVYFQAYTYHIENFLRSYSSLACA